MKKILVINGPNLNLLGKRNPEVYGSKTLEDLQSMLAARFPEVEIVMMQSNCEGEIIDAIHRADGVYDGVVLNAGAYSHYSIAIADAIESVSLPVVEVHISNIFAREEFRRHSVLAPVCIGTIAGFGFEGYCMAVDALLRR